MCQILFGKIRTFQLEDGVEIFSIRPRHLLAKGKNCYFLVKIIHVTMTFSLNSFY